MGCVATRNLQKPPALRRNMQDLTVYYAPSCAFSLATLVFLASRGADAHVVNLEQHPTHRAQLQARLGDRKLETPTLQAGSDLHIAPPLAELKKLLAHWGLPDDAAPYEQLHSKA
jgi:glutaredoxin